MTKVLIHLSGHNNAPFKKNVQHRIGSRARAGGLRGSPFYASDAECIVTTVTYVGWSVGIGNRAPKCMNGLINIWLRSDAVSCADYLRAFREQMEENYWLKAYSQWGWLICTGLG